MALFKKDTEKDLVETPEEVKDGAVVTDPNDLSWVLKKPRITEKAAFISADNAYTFDVAPRANKIQIKKAIIEQYKVTPVKITVINRKARKETRRGRQMHITGTKKAMVFLKKGDSIEFV